MSDIGIITIGRNEGDRLRRCLGSVLGRRMAVVYVDSQSSDGSADFARRSGVEVVELDAARPLCAARARNGGFDRLVRIDPKVKYVQFLDGDCELVDGWLDRARREIESRGDVAVVCGRRRERCPQNSIYNRLADLEWDTPIGDAASCGGDALVRAGAFRSVNGFDATVAAGEEPEFCQRLRSRGWKVLRIDAEMTLHDSNMLRFSQWWRRAVRSGYGAMDVATRFGSQGLFVGQVHSARLWAIGWPIAVLAATLVAFANVALFAGIRLGWRAGLRFGTESATIAAGILLLAFPVQALRIAARVRPRTRSWRDAIAYGTFTLIGKWAHVRGQRQYLRDRAAGSNTRSIEYKVAPAGSVARAASP